MSDADLLREVLREVRAMRADLEALASRGRLTREDRALLAELFKAAAPVFREERFATIDVLEWRSLAPIVDGHTAASLSWLFGRAEKVTVAGYRIERTRPDRTGAQWRLRRLHGEVIAMAAGEPASMVAVDNDDQGCERDGTGLSHENGGRGIPRRKKHTG